MPRRDPPAPLSARLFILRFATFSTFSNHREGREGGGGRKGRRTTSATPLRSARVNLCVCARQHVPRSALMIKGIIRDASRYRDGSLASSDRPTHVAASHKLVRKTLALKRTEKDALVTLSRMGHAAVSLKGPTADRLSKLFHFIWTVSIGPYVLCLHGCTLAGKTERVNKGFV